MDLKKHNKIRAKHDPLIKESLELEKSNQKFKKKIMVLRKKRLLFFNKLFLKNRKEIKNGRN